MGENPAMPDPKKTKDSNFYRDEVNAKVLNTVANTNIAAIGVASDEALAVSYESLAHSLALVMQNAGSTQFEMKQIEAAAVAKTVERILSLAK